MIRKGVTMWLAATSTRPEPRTTWQSGMPAVRFRKKWRYFGSLPISGFSGTRLEHGRPRQQSGRANSCLRNALLAAFDKASEWWWASVSSRSKNADLPQRWPNQLLLNAQSLFLFRRERKAAKNASSIHESPHSNPVPARPTVISFIREPRRARVSKQTCEGAPRDLRVTAWGGGAG